MEWTKKLNNKRNERKNKHNKYKIKNNCINLINIIEKKYTNENDKK